jgi:hypothetical protein
MNQLNLFDDVLNKLEPISQVKYEKDLTQKERFVQFHKANPHVYHMLVAKAIALKRRGIDRYGIAAIWEALRYSRAMYSATDDYKLNNNYKAYYARLIMKTVAELEGYFSTRAQSAPGSNEEIWVAIHLPAQP